MRMSRLLTAALVSIGVGGFVAAATPAAASGACAQTATITQKSGTGYVKWFGAEAPNGAKFTGKTLRHSHFYELHGVTVTLSFGTNTYRLDHNAVLLLSCSATAKGQPAKMPNLVMLRGRAVVKTTRTYLGSVQTEEGLFAPIPGSAATSYQLTRTLRQTTPLTFGQEMEWFHNTIHQPTGTSTHKRLSTQKVNVTPYVGPRIGTCRHVVSATLSSTAWGKGTATYHF
jgi:hypothetical protein